VKRFVHPTAGKVYIVGAGPGDPGLLTVRGLAYLRQAQVVVHDRLVHPALLDEVSPTATCIDVGKAPGRHPYPQSAINALLIRKASEGHMVVRLKGGDPFVFGRGGEECQALAAAGVPFEVVPGVSSAIAVPAYAGIPVTHRAYTRAFTVITGHTCDADDTALDWQSLARTGTLVILMGLSRLATIAERLIAHGRAPDTPVAVIQWGTTTDQTVVAGPLATIAEKARELQSPATIVVGEVVELRHDLQWFDLPQVTQTIEPDAAAMPYTIAAALTATACLSPS
jgi:uroporphyrin-III C-methyltransferase